MRPGRLVLAGVVASYLDRAGFDTTVTGDGLEAVELARTLDPATAPGCRSVFTLTLPDA